MIAARAAEAAFRLAGYVTGTHSGLHGVRSPHRASARAVLEALRAFPGDEGPRGEQVVLGATPWAPRDEAERALHASLHRALGADGVIDLTLFGSIARASTTGYSDVDGILVVEDRAVTDPATLRALRARVLAAGRAVLEYQPLQHHGFHVVTPALLAHGAAALRLPAEALESTASLFARPTRVTFGAAQAAPGAAFRALARTLLQIESWPRHAWHAHRTVAMFELAPALYLQARGHPCAKHRSYELARADFPEEWLAYDVLREVRALWPRQPRPALRRTAAALRNPWTAVAVWRRLPARVPTAIAALLDDECLQGLQRLIRSMAARVP